MTLYESLLLVVSVANAGTAAFNIWCASANARNAQRNAEVAGKNLATADRATQLARQLQDLHKARMAIYSALDARLNARLEGGE